MKKILLFAMLWLSMLFSNGCVTVHYPDEYWGWPEDRRSEWREHNHLRWYERYEDHRQGRHEERFEEHREEHHEEHQEEHH
jgi:hypothetical protein